MNSPLISPEALAMRIQAGDCLVVDTRHDLSEPARGRHLFGESRIPGARFLSIDDDLSAPKTGTNGRHPLPDAAAFAETLGRHGIGCDDPVVVYDQGSAMFAGRLWWMLRWLGHSRVWLLDGGFAAWQAAGLPIETGRSSANLVAKTYVPDEQRHLVVDAAQMLSALARPETRIVDARTPERFRGESEPIDPVAGHIPGAVNRPFALNLRDGRFKPSAELAAEWAKVLAGRSPGDVIHQCGSGVSALANMVAMEHAGLHGSRLYAGSWSEWCSDPARPIARG